MLYNAIVFLFWTMLVEVEDGIRSVIEEIWTQMIIEYPKDMFLSHFNNITLTTFVILATTPNGRKLDIDLLQNLLKPIKSSISSNNSNLKFKN